MMARVTLARTPGTGDGLARRGRRGIADGAGEGGTVDTVAAGHGLVFVSYAVDREPTA
jgi:hypothetical protein